MFDNAICKSSVHSGGKLLSASGPFSRLRKEGAAMLLLGSLTALMGAPLHAATISGTVTEQATDNPIDGATVCIFRTNGQMVGDCGTTDTNGDYQAINVPAESGLVALAEASSFASEFWDDVVIYEGHEAGTPIDVSSSNATGIDFALDMAGTLQGSVTEAGSGADITTGQVTLLDTSGGQLFDAVANIQPDASYNLADVAPGDYLIAFTARGAAASYIDEIHDNVLCPDLGCDLAALGTPVTITANNTTTINAQLETGSVVSGTVSKSDGGDITEGQVTLLDPAGNFAGTEPITGDGSYELLPVPDGDYTLLFRPAGMDSNYIAELYDEIPCPLGGCFATSNPATFTISGSDVTKIEELDPGFTISGSVTDAGNGSDINEGFVDVFEADGTRLGSVPIDSGAYSTDGLPSGDYKLHFGAPGPYLDELYDEISCEGSCDFSNLGNLVTISGSNQVIDEELATSNIIMGQVTDQGSGSPLTSDASVVVFDSMGNQVATTNVDGSGMYAAAVPDGDYYVFFDTFGSNNGYIDEVHQDVPCPDQGCDITSVGTQVTVSGADVTIDAALTQAGRLSGTVSKAASGNPISSGQVELRQPDGSFFVGSGIDSNGNYDLGGLPDGDYRLYFAADGADSAFIDEAFDDVACPRRSCDLASAGTTITISGSPLSIDEELVRGNVVSGTIKDSATGNDIAAGNIQVFDVGGDFIFNQAYAGGTFELDGLPDADYLLHFAADPDGNDGWVGEFYDNLSCPALACDFVAAADPLMLSGDASLSIDLAQGTVVDGNVTADSGPGTSGIPGSVEFFDSAGNPVVTVFTDSDGNYSITLPDGEYRALARANDQTLYIPELWSDLPCPAGNCDPATGGPIMLGGTPQTFDFSLSQGFSITGEVTEAASGNLLQGVQIQIREAGSSQNLASTFTDSNGDYVSPALLAGDYKIFTNAFDIDGVVNEVYDNVPCIGNFCDVASGAPVTLGSPGDATGIDFALDPDVPFGGQVVDSTTGEPLDNVNISVWEATTGDTNFVGNTTTDSAGMFSIDRVIDGDYAMRFERDGYVTQFFDGNTPEDQTPPYCPDATCFGFPGPTVNVPPSGVTDLEVDMDPGATVTGTIFGPDGNPVTAGFSGVRVRVFDENGEPAGFRFTAPQPSGQPPGNTSYTAELPPGQWFFLFETSDANLGLVDTAFGGQPCPRGSCGMATTTPIQVSAGEELTGFDGQLSEGAQLQGQLLNDDEMGDPPLPEFTAISFYDADGEYAGFGLSDANGDFVSWTGFPPGTYFGATVFEFGTTLRSNSPPGFIDELYDNNPCVNGCDYTTGNPIEVTSGDIGGIVAENIVVALSQGGSIAGTVTDENMNPIAGANVKLFKGGGSLAGEQATDGNGDYIFEGLNAGDYFAVTDNDAGFEDELYDNMSCEPSCNPLNGTPITLMAGGAVTATDFSLATAASLSGSVTDNTRAPVPDIDIEVYNAIGEQVGTSTTDANGDWQVNNLAAGDYFIRTRNDAGLRDEVYADMPCSGCDVTTGTVVSLMPGQQASGIDFDLILAGGIEGNVSATAAGGGQPITGVAVRVFTPSGNLVASDMSDSNGNWAVEGLAQGDYHVLTESSLGFVDEVHDNPDDSVCEPDCVPTAGDAITVATSIETANFELDPAASIAGTIAADTGDSVSGVTVQAFDNAGELLRSAATGGEGGYEIGGLPQGDVFLRTDTDGSFTDQVYEGVDCTSACDVGNGDPVALAPGDEATGIDFQLTPGGSVTGEVTAGGSTQTSLDVRIFDAASSPVATVATDGNGEFLVQGLLDGRYFARTDNSRGLVDEVFDDMACTPDPCGITMGTPIDIEDGAQVNAVDFQLDNGASLEDIATDQFGNPLPDGEVVLFDDQGREIRRTPITDGNWSFNGVANGTYFLVVLNGSGLVDELFDDMPCPGASCDVTAGTPVSVSGAREPGNRGTSQDLGFELAPGSTISGHVDGPSGGVTGATVYFFDADGDVAGKATTNAAGNYESESAFPAGDYFVATTDRQQRGVGEGLVNELYDDTPCPLECDVTTGMVLSLDGSADVEDIDFTLAAGGALAGQAFDDLGNALAGARVEVYDAMGTLAGTTTVDSLGNWRVSGLPSGDYTAVLRTPLQQSFENAVLGAGTCQDNCDPQDGQLLAVSAPDETGDADFVLFPAGVLFRNGFEETVTRSSER